MDKPRAARGVFPYNHRTVAQVDREIERVRKGFAVRRRNLDYEDPNITDTLKEMFG